MPGNVFPGSAWFKNQQICSWGLELRGLPLSAPTHEQKAESWRHTASPCSCREALVGAFPRVPRPTGMWLAFGLCSLGLGAEW